MSIFAKNVSCIVSGKQVKRGKEAVEFTGTVTSIIFNSCQSQSIYMPITRVFLDCEKEGIALSSEDGEICSAIKETLFIGFLDKLGDKLLKSRRNTPFWDDC